MILAPDQVRLSQVGPGISRVEHEGSVEVGSGTGLIASHAVETTRHERRRVVGTGLDRLGERGLRVGMSTDAGERLGVRGHDRRGSHVQRQGSLEVDQGLLGMAELEESKTSIDPRLRELRIELERMIVGLQRLRESAAPGKRQPAVQLRPGELGNQDRAGTEIGRGVGVPPLIAVADPRANQVQNCRGLRSIARLNRASARSG